MVNKLGWKYVEYSENTEILKILWTRRNRAQIDTFFWWKYVYSFSRNFFAFRTGVSRFLMCFFKLNNLLRCNAAVNCLRLIYSAVIEVGGVQLTKCRAELFYETLCSKQFLVWQFSNVFKWFQMLIVEFSVGYLHFQVSQGHFKFVFCQNIDDIVNISISTR